MPNKRAAHFLLLAYLHNSPPNDALTKVYEELGYEVIFFAPDNESFNQVNKTAIKHATYGIRWLLKNIFSKRWREYDAISCTSEDPIAIASVIAFIWRKPLIFLADEIKSGSYYGNRPEYFKKLCRWGMRRARCTIVNDAARIELQRNYAQLSETQPVVVYPGCYLQPPSGGNTEALRASWGVGDNEFVLSHSGSFGSNRGIEWIFDSLGHSDTVKLLLQPLGINPLTRYFIKNHRNFSKMILSEERLSWHDAWQSASAVDCGLVIYLDQGPQFQLMGISSNRLCMFLAMGVPVIATWQPSFQFIEEFNCGVLIKDPRDFDTAVEKVRNNQQSMKENALRCAREYIDTATKYQNVKEHMKQVLG